MDASKLLHKGYRSQFQVERGAAQAIVTGINTVVQWDVENVDLLGEMAIINPWTFVPLQAGYYLFGCHMRMLNMVLARYLQVRIELNGVPEAASLIECGNAGQDIHPVITAFLYVTPADTIRVTVVHNNGANRNIGGSGIENFFWGHRIN